MRRVLPALVALSIGWLALDVVLPASTRLTNGFSAYYTAGRLVREGAPVARFYDDEWFRAQTLRLGFDRAPDIYNVNPPAASLILWPLSMLDPVNAKVAWTVLNLSFLAVIAGFIGRLVSGRGAGGSSAFAFGVTLAMIGVFQPVDENVRQGQAYALLLLVEVVFTLGFLARRDRMAGTALAGLLVFKSAGLGFPLMLLAQRRWRAAGWTVLVASVVVASTSLLFGSDAWTTYLGLLANVGTRREIAVTAYQSVPGFIAHLFRFDAQWNLRPILDVPEIVAPLTAATIVALVGFTTWRTWQASSNVTASAAVVVSAWSILDVVVSPASADYHYTLAVVPIALLLVDQVRRERVNRISLALLLVAIIAIGAPWPQRIFASGDGLAALGAYPRLYGAVLLWGVAIHRLGGRPLPLGEG